MVATWDEGEPDLAVIRHGWQDFHKGEMAISGVRPSILASWRRSQEAGIRPDQPGALIVWNDAELNQARADQQLLLQAASPTMAALKQMIEGTGQVVGFFDPTARALLVEGDKEARQAAERIHLVPGSDWSEQSSGTNAMGTAAAEGEPFVVFGTEHYLEDLHPWACVAAPVRHPITGELVGVLDISGRYMEITPHSQMAVNAGAQAIETRLALLETTHRQVLLEAFADRLARSRQAEISVIDRHGRLLKVSGSNLQSLQQSPIWGVGMKEVMQAASVHHEMVILENERHLRLTFEPVTWSETVVGALVEATVTSGSAAETGKSPLPGLVGSNPTWLAALERATRAARTEATVLIVGDTGTGKEVVAKAVHQASNRSKGPFIPVNCGALSPTLVASELFGYVGGAFTGANPKGSPGKAEAANGGTLFLDEIGELAPEAQVSLLRMLQEREVVRVGSNQPISVDLRVIAATHRNLSKMVAEGTFRQDLFFRLNVVPIHLPPLRERREDILPLIKFAYQRFGVEPPELGLAAYERLTTYDWPGNVRELLNLVEQAVVLRENPADLLPLAPLPSSKEFGEAGEEEQVRRALDENGGNAAAAARALGMSRSTLYRKLEHYGIRLKRQVE